MCGVRLASREGGRERSPQVLTQIELFTDDNFQFSRAAKAIRQAIEGLPCIYPALEPPDAKHLPEEEKAELKKRNDEILKNTTLKLGLKKPYDLVKPYD